MTYIGYVLFDYFYPVILCLRAVTGNIWLPVELPAGLRGVTISGDPEAVSRGALGWRLQWRWVMLRKIHPAYIYFTDASGQSRRYARLVKEGWVLVRIGPEDVTFRAFAPDGKEVSLLYFIGPDSRRDMMTLTKGLQEPIRWI